jgi:hypothetical protein
MVASPVQRVIEGGSECWADRPASLPPGRRWGGSDRGYQTTPAESAGCLPSAERRRGVHGFRRPPFRPGASLVRSPLP